MMKIKELEAGQKLTLPLLVARFTRGVTQNGAPYLSITFQDDSGEIEGKIWDVKEEHERVVTVGSIVEVSCDVLKYRNNLQLRVHAVQALDQKNFTLSDFVNATSYDLAFLKKEIESYTQSIEDSIMRECVEACFAYYGDQFYQYPAATRNHHDFVGGLATHVYGMCHLADAVCALYEIYNRDLLIAGVLLHDMAKIDEYTAPILSEYTAAGRLLGHISMQHARFSEIANGLGYGDTEQVLLLRHMILSHHGKLEYGSPVLPMVKEAEMLTFIDNMDARTNMFEKFYDDLPEGEFSPRMFALDNRNFYKAKGVK